MKHSSAKWQDIKAELDFLLSLNTRKVKALIVDDLLDNAPIEPRKAQLNVKARHSFAPSLQVVNVLDLFEYVEVFVFQVHCMDQLTFVFLIHANETI